MSKKQKVQAAKVQENGVFQPAETSTKGKVWAICNAIREAGEELRQKDVIDKAYGEGVNPATAMTAFQQYRKFHGLEKSRVVGDPTVRREKTQKSIEFHQAAIERLSAKLAKLQG